MRAEGGGAGQGEGGQPGPVQLVMGRIGPANELPKGGVWRARCPACEAEGKLRLARGRDGRALLSCSEGCSTKAICSALELRVADLYPPKKPAAPAAGPGPRPFGTDTWLAEQFVLQQGPDLRFCGPWKEWLVWGGNGWRRDDSGEPERRMKEVIRGLYLQAMKEEDPDRRAALVEFAVKSESAGKRRAALELGSYEGAVQVHHDQLDAQPMLLNVLNGTVDLATGGHRPALREDLLTKRAQVAYEAGAACPRWEAFLERIFAGDREMISFVQRMAGYMLTGDVGEHCLFIFHGRGANGKSTLAETLMKMLGDYGMPGAAGLLEATKHDRHPTEMADLFRARLVVCQEVEEGKRFNESRVKALTGGDRVKARRMQEDFWWFDPTHKFIIPTNHKPKIRGEDDGIWRRIRLVPFEVQIPVEERDHSLPQRLLLELPGILNWAIAGCLAWQQEGLRPPSKVTAATDAYRASEDAFGSFLAECCLEKPNAWCWVDEIYAAYQHWADRAGEYPMAKREFGIRLSERGFLDGKGAQGRRRWTGLGLLDTARPPLGGASGASSGSARNAASPGNDAETTPHTPPRDWHDPETGNEDGDLDAR